METKDESKLEASEKEKEDAARFNQYCEQHYYWRYHRAEFCATLDAQIAAKEKEKRTRSC